MRYDLELPSQPSASHRVAVLLINLGTPDAPTPKAVRKYLAQFLSDPRVVEIPALAWQVILRLAILPFRGRASAKKDRKSTRLNSSHPLKSRMPSSA